MAHTLRRRWHCCRHTAQNLRSAVIERQHPVYNVNSKDGNFLFFSSYGAPHPYNADIFETAIKCQGPSGNYELIPDKSNELWKTNFKKTEPGIGKIEKCDVYSLRGEDLDYKLYSTEKLINVNDSYPKELKYITEASYDAYINNDETISVEPSRKFSAAGESSYLDTQGRVTMRFPIQPLSDKTMLALEVKANADLKIGILYWQGEKAISRYYPSLKKDKNNLVVISHLGFDNAYSINSVDGLSLIIYTDKQESKAQLKLNKLYVLDNQYQLYKLLERRTTDMLLDEHE